MCIGRRFGAQQFITTNFWMLSWKRVFPPRMKSERKTTKRRMFNIFPSETQQINAIRGHFQIELTNDSNNKKNGKTESNNTINKNSRYEHIISNSKYINLMKTISNSLFAFLPFDLSLIPSWIRYFLTNQNFSLLRLALKIVYCLFDPIALL